jgi:plasmid replication initiation protein
MSLMKVAKSNYLVEACYSLTLQEHRLILACLARVDSRKEISKEVCILASDYASMMQIDIKNAHRELYKAAEKLYDRSISVNDPEKVEEFRWIQKKALYHKGEGKVTFTWSDDVLVYLSHLQRRFTTYRLHDVARFSSSYSIRLYELLIQFYFTKERWISVESFKSYLNLENKYSSFRDLNKRVVKTAIKEINDTSNLTVLYKTVKSGRKVTALCFFLALKN